MPHKLWVVNPALRTGRVSIVFKVEKLRLIATEGPGGVLGRCHFEVLKVGQAMTASGTAIGATIFIVYNSVYNLGRLRLVEKGPPED